MGSIIKGKKLFKAKTTMFEKSIGLPQNVPLTPIFKALWRGGLRHGSFHFK